MRLPQNALDSTLRHHLTSGKRLMEVGRPMYIDDPFDIG